MSKANDVEMVASHFVPPLLDAILVDYKTNIAEGIFILFYLFVNQNNFWKKLTKCSFSSARDSEVLSVMACIVNKLRGLITPQVISCFSPFLSSFLFTLFSIFDLIFVFFQDPSSF